MSASKEKKGALAGDHRNQKQERAKEKLIRLDDLIPKESVRGGRQFVFGESDTQQTTQKTKE